jgi:hypothetical protein
VLCCAVLQRYIERLFPPLLSVIRSVAEGRLELTLGHHLGATIGGCRHGGGTCFAEEAQTQLNAGTERRRRSTRRGASGRK